LLYDHDGDGYDDLYMTSYAELRDDGLRNENQFYRSTGDSFVERVGDATGPAGSRCVAAGDVDGDGDDDLVVCADRLRLFVNDGWSHVAADDLLGDPIADPVDAVFGDLDRDGRDDLVVVTSFSVEIRFGVDGMAEADVTMPLLRGTSAVITHLAGDGRPDLYVVQGCRSGVDVPDLLVTAPRWRIAPISGEPASGCGSQAAVVDGAVMVFNGTRSLAGPIAVVTSP
jgi:hypothetical protein